MDGPGVADLVGLARRDKIIHSGKFAGKFANLRIATANFFLDIDELIATQAVVIMSQTNVTGRKPLNARELGLHKPVYSINEALDLLPVGRTKLYELIKRGDLEVFHVGKRAAITAPAIVDLINRLRGEAA